MQEKLAILIADLSGYTALTETHGAEAAADTVERYMNVVNSCLVGFAKIHQRVGDEVMLLSSSPDDLLATAIMLLQKAHAEENFLLLHGGLHYGELLQRHESFFGTAINLASRIASKAAAGNIWCSRQFLAALCEPSAASFTSKGKHGVKNLSEEEEFFEIVLDERAELYVDPVCRMLIINHENAVSHSAAPGVYFCSEGCRNIYLDRS